MDLDSNSDIGKNVQEISVTTAERGTTYPGSRAVNARGKRSTGGRGGELALDARHAYMGSIQEIPVLSKAEVARLSHELQGHRAVFEQSMTQIEGTAQLLLARWEQRRQHGRVTAALSRHHREAGRGDPGPELDLEFGRLQRLLGRTSIPWAQVTRLLDRTEISFEVLVEIYEELSALTDSERRSHGLATAAARRTLAESGSALDQYRDLVSKLAEHNLRLVVKCAHRYRSMGVPFMDLVQEGNLGLLRAVEKFDPDKGFMFSTYAVWWIQQAMIRAVQNQRRTVRIPSHVCELQVRYRRVVEELSRRLGRKPEAEELTEALRVDRPQLDAVIASLVPERSIHSPVPGLDAISYEDVIEDVDAAVPGEALEQERLRGAIGTLLDNLGPRERAVVASRFGLRGDDDAETLGEIGTRLGLSRERVRQIECAALARLRSLPEAQHLRGLLAEADDAA